MPPAGSGVVFDHGVEPDDIIQGIAAVFIRTQGGGDIRPLSDKFAIYLGGFRRRGMSMLPPTTPSFAASGPEI